MKTLQVIPLITECIWSTSWENLTGDMRQCKTQTGLFSWRSQLESINFGMIQSKHRTKNGADLISRIRLWCLHMAVTVFLLFFFHDSVHLDLPSDGVVYQSYFMVGRMKLSDGKILFKQNTAFFSQWLPLNYFLSLYSRQYFFCNLFSATIFWLLHVLSALVYVTKFFAPIQCH